MTDALPVSPTPSYVQYLRSVQLYLVSPNSQALDVSNLHIRFTTKEGTVSTPSSCQIRVFNVSEATSQRIESEFNSVILSAGYEGASMAQIFAGELIQVRRGRDSPVDTYLDLTAAAADEDICWSIVQTAVHAGSSFRQRAEVLAKAMNRELGYVDVAVSVDAQTLPRGITYNGMARDFVHNLGAASDTNWYVDKHGKLNMIKQNGYLPTDVPVLTPATGLIGFPEQGSGGFTVKCLLNPKLTLNQLIEIRTGDITVAPLSLDIDGLAQQEKLPAFPQGAASVGQGQDGIYRIVVLEHEGDTRGQAYYSNMTCLALSDLQVPDELVQKGHGGG